MSPEPWGPRASVGARAVAAHLPCLVCGKLATIAEGDTFALCYPDAFLAATVFSRGRPR